MSLTTVALLRDSATKAAADFVISIQCEKAQGKLVPGQISVNDQIIGQTYDPDIPILKEAKVEYAKLQ